LNIKVGKEKTTDKVLHNVSIYLKRKKKEDKEQLESSSQGNWKSVVSVETNGRVKILSQLP
jgi:hypothetical protein